MKISQREAHCLKKRVVELEGILSRQKNRWAEDWVAGWVNIETLSIPETSFSKIDISRRLGHAVIAVPNGLNKIMFYAERLK